MEINISYLELYLVRRGFHYIAVREMEMEIPIPSNPGIFTNSRVCLFHP